MIVDKVQSKFIKHIPCEHCGSKDANLDLKGSVNTIVVDKITEDVLKIVDKVGGAAVCVVSQLSKENCQNT
jgi:hypothetical protein